MGERGCLDNFASIPSILESLRLQHGDISFRQFMRLLGQGDLGATRPVSHAAQLVVMVMASACKFLAPQEVVTVGR